MSQDHLKKAAAEAALQFIPDRAALGVGTGSTAGCFIAALSSVRAKISRIVASSEDTARKLENAGFPCADPNAVGDLDLYVDGADEADAHLRLIKGGGGAHAREKVLAACARRFVLHCGRIQAGGLDWKVPPAGGSPADGALPGRPQTRRHGRQPRVARRVCDRQRQLILDVRNLDLSRAEEMEMQINAIPGAVENGIFARRRADLLVVAGKNGIRLEGKEAA